MKVERHRQLRVRIGLLTDFMQVWGSPVLLGENEEKRTGHMIVRPRLLYIIDFMSWYSLWDFFEFSAIAFHMMVINMVAVKKSSRDWDRFLHSIYLFWITRVNKDLYT